MRISHSIPLLITLDLELAPDHDLTAQGNILDTLKSDFQRLDLPMTVFATSDAVERFAPQVKSLVAAGHEIGCHGMTHAPDEHFGRMREARTFEVLSEATHRIQQVVGEVQRPRVFRGPSMTTSSITQAALERLGYRADFSVCPGRLDLLSSRGGHPGWLVAPRAPYHPSRHSPYLRGSMPMVVVPLSAWGVPLMSGTLYTLGLNAMCWLFQRCVARAQALGGSVVFLFHSYELTEYRPQPERLAPQPFRQRLYLQDRVLRKRLLLEFLRIMRSDPQVQPMTAMASLNNDPH